MKRHPSPALITCGYAMASASIASATPSFGRGSSSAFVHQITPALHRRIIPNPSSTVTVALHEGATIDDKDSMIDDTSFNALFNDNADPSSSSASWDISDDWTSLSSDVNAAARNFFASPGGTTGGTNVDVMEQAARILEEQEQVMSEWDTTTTADNEKSINDASAVKGSKDDFVENAVEIIASNMDYNEPGNSDQLYDTVATVKAKDTNREENEMAFMIRCNQSPDQFLISQGRAVPELTEEVKYASNFLLQELEAVDETTLPLQPKATVYLENAVETIFDACSILVKEEKVLDRKAISAWMTTCISSSLSDSPNNFRIGPHDQGVNAILGRYSQHHGSGQLTLPEFQALYLEVTWSGYIHGLIKDKASHGGVRSYPIPDATVGVLVEGRKNSEKMLKQASLAIVWRDLEAHGIFSPAEEEHVALLIEMEKLQATATAAAASSKNSQLLMDECELFEDYEDRLSHSLEFSDDNQNDILGEERAWEFLKRKEKSSHELVEMAFDGKTPKRIRDGEFVFIDEESCIGCTQCAQIAPSVFQMIEESGRARTFNQKNTLEAENAVMACPVTCMHYMSFDELKEMESARDHGDGRTDHRHMGKGHIPLYVSGIDSDANHKSSWYHYLKHKCHGSHTCPQRGCYDCPTYNPGKNPFFQERHKQAELVRAKDFMATGEADKWRKVLEL